MATYIVLANFTDQGAKNIKDTTKRADAVKEQARKFGVTPKEVLLDDGRARRRGGLRCARRRRR